MKSSIVAVAIAAALAAGTANAGFYCKLEGYSSGLEGAYANNVATHKYLAWHFGQPFPDTSEFDYRTKDVVCFVDGGILYEVLPNIGGLKKIPMLSNGPTQGPGSGAKVGLVYRGDDARWLIDNLRSYPGTVAGNSGYLGDGVERGDFFADVKP